MPTDKSSTYSTPYLAMGLPWSEEFAGVGALLRHVNAEFKKHWPVGVFSITLDEYIAGDEYHPGLFIVYDYHDQSTLKFIQKTKDECDEDKSWAADSFESLCIEVFYGTLVCVDLRLEKGRDQDNIPKLLDKVASYLEERNIKQVLSFSFDSTGDDDGIERPVIRVIYQQVK